MVLLVLSADHRGVDLDLLQRLAAQVAEAGAGAGRAAIAAGVANGAVTLSTCNRVEVYLDTEDPAAGQAYGHALLAGGTEPVPGVRALAGPAAINHLFSVASGLESMVVGEREIVGQVRTALAAARAAGVTTGLLETAFQQALRVSRAVEAGTALGSAGRSLVAAALDLTALPDWSAARCLLVGTGSYAGASLAALRARDVRDVAVLSGSGRAAQFAAGHGVQVAADAALELARADLVVACSGAAGTALTADLVAAARADRADPLVVIDLALTHDVEPAVGTLPGVRLITLRDLAAGPQLTGEPARSAQELVDAAAARFEVDLRARAWDRAVVEARSRVLAALRDETDSAPTARRRVHAALHGPTVRARAAARAGDRTGYEVALAELAALSASVLTASGRTTPVGTPGDQVAPAAGPTSASPRSAGPAGADPAAVGPASTRLTTGARPRSTIDLRAGRLRPRQSRWSTRSAASPV